MSCSSVYLLKRVTEGGAVRTVVIHRSTNEPGKWQASEFMEDGEPWGHNVFDSLEDAVRGYSGEHGKWGPPYAVAGDFKVSERGFADIKKSEQKGFAFSPVDVPGQSKEKALEDLFQQILQAEDSSVSKRQLLGLDKKRKAGNPPKGSLFDSEGLFKER